MNKLDLEFRCRTCDGNGTDIPGGFTRCSTCGGIGWLPSNDGRALLRFLERHLNASRAPGAGGKENAGNPMTRLPL